jgi:DNA-binding transcriptional ArsR family regulator
LKARPPDPFAALADPTRRAILEALRDEGVLSAGDIAARFPAISRPAVSKHVGILRRAKLVRGRVRGREMRYRLDAAPLAEVYRGWLATFVPVMEDSLRELKRRAEAD